MKRLKVLVICLAIVVATDLLPSGLDANTAFAESENGNVLEFNIKVLPELQPYVDLLKYPSYLAVALNTNARLFGMSGQLALINGQSLSLNNLIFLELIKEDGPLFLYQMTFRRGIKFSATFEVSVSDMRKGNVLMRVHIPLSKWFPENVIDRIRSTISRLTEMRAQEEMLKYLNGLQKKFPQSSGTVGVLESILMDGYNVSNASSVGYLNNGTIAGGAFSPYFYYAIAIMVVLLIIIPIIVILKKGHK
jgi:hypothetical protein